MSLEIPKSVGYGMVPLVVHQTQTLYSIRHGGVTMEQQVKSPAKLSATVRRAIAAVLHDRASSKAAKVADGLSLTMRRG